MKKILKFGIIGSLIIISTIIIISYLGAPVALPIIENANFCKHIMQSESIQFEYPCGWTLDTYPQSNLPYRPLAYFSTNTGEAFGDLQILDATGFVGNLDEVGQKNLALAQNEAGFHLVGFNPDVKLGIKRANTLMYEYSYADPDIGSNSLNRVVETSFDLYGKIIVTRFEAMAYIIDGESAFSQQVPEVNTVINSIK